jgi:hypothetical protein
MAGFSGAGFQPVRRTGKMPVPPKTFRRKQWCAVRTLHAFTEN